mgnify:CR=1 FL=1
MKHNPFFNPSPLYKEFILLDVIEKNPSITQRGMSSLLNVSVSMVNEYITQYESEGYLKRIYASPKKVTYQITASGKKRQKLLNIWYLDASQQVYNSAKQNILEYLHDLKQKGYDEIYLYGAGEVAEIFLQVIRFENIDLRVLGIIDDDVDKQGQRLFDYAVIPYDEVAHSNYDGILVSTYGYHEHIREKLIDKGISNNKILGYF